MISQEIQDDEDGNQFIAKRFLLLNSKPSMGNSKNDQLPTVLNDQTKTQDSQVQDDQSMEAIANSQQINKDDFLLNFINNQAEQETIKAEHSTTPQRKNAAKLLGNYLRKHITKKNLIHIPQLTHFANKKKVNKQVNYTLQDWREIILNNNEYKTLCQRLFWIISKTMLMLIFFQS